MFLRDDSADRGGRPSGWPGPVRALVLRPNGDGEVESWCCCWSSGTEVEVKLPGRFKVSPQIAGAIKARCWAVEACRLAQAL